MKYYISNKITLYIYEFFLFSRELDHCDPYDEFHDHPGRRFLDHFLNVDNESSSQERKHSVQVKIIITKKKNI